MRVIRFNDVENRLKLQVDSFDDLYLVERILSGGDMAESRSFRRFRGNEEDVGEQKEVVVKIDVEKIELDRGAQKLRINGRIVSGRPEEYIKIGGYHTLNIGSRDVIEIEKKEWKSYILRRIKQAVDDTKRPRLAIVAMDEEKATFAYVKGYGIDVITEIYSHLSKRMKEKDFLKTREDYFKEIINGIGNLDVEIVVLAGPGFTKDDIKRYMNEKEISAGKKLLYVQAGDAERSGIREAAQSEEVAKAVEQQQVKKEFDLLNAFMAGLRTNASFYGNNEVTKSLESYVAGVVLVNDSVLNIKDFQRVLDVADSQKVRIEIFNSEDEAGKQLRGFRDIASISRKILEGDRDLRV